MPDWVEQMPEDSDFYWARENIGIRGLTEEEYKSKAKEQALKTISMQISMMVSVSLDQVLGSQ